MSRKSKRRKRKQIGFVQNDSGRRISSRTGTPIDAEFWPSRRSTAGVYVSAQSMLEFAPIWYGISKIAGHVGIANLELKKRDADGTTRDTERGELPVRELVSEAPNELMSAIVWKELVQWQAILQGDGRTAIVRRGGSAVELIPMPSERSNTVIIRRQVNEWLPEKWHYSTTQNGGVVWVPDRDCLHIMSMSRDGLVGMSLVDLARNSVGGGLAAEQYANRTFANDAVPGLLFEVEEGVFADDDEAQDFIDNFNRFHAGSENASKAGLLPEGVKANAHAIKGRDGQFIEQRRFSREEAAMWTGVETMLGVDNSVSYNSLEQRNQAYLQNGLLKWLVKWKQEADRKLLSERERRAGYFWQWDTKRILQGSLMERLQAYQISRQISLQSQEEIREQEGLPPADPTHNFGNPSTTPGEPVQPGGRQADDEDPETPPVETEDDEDDESQANMQLERIVRKQITDALAFRTRNLTRYASKPAFVERATSFADRYKTMLADLIGTLGGDPGLAKPHVDHFVAAITEIACRADKDTLRPMLDEYSERTAEPEAEYLIREIIGI